MTVMYVMIVVIGTCMSDDNSKWNWIKKLYVTNFQFKIMLPIHVDLRSSSIIVATTEDSPTLAGGLVD